MKIKKALLTTGTIVLGLLTAAPALAQMYNGPGYAPPPYFGDHHHHLWHHGEFYHGPADVVHHPGAFGLPWPPHGFIWVRTPHQFVLINAGNGWIDHAVFR